MSKKHFEDLAAMMKGLTGQVSERSRELMADELAKVCARHNASFSRYRFLVACGVRP
jgi:hypothetical protein